MLHYLLKTDKLLIAQSYAYGEHYQDGYGFNLALHVNDNPTKVLKNRTAFLKMLNDNCGHNIQSLHWLNQIHSNAVYEVQDTIFVNPVSADALITDKAGVGLCIMTADCVPIVLFSQDNNGNIGQIANIHAGWQGLVKGVINETHAKFNKGENVYAYIGACISGGCYEIPKTMANDIISKCQTELNLTKSDIEKTILEKDDEKVWFAVGELAKVQLQTLGVQVLNDKIDCTYTGNYFSHRKATHHNQANTGRMAMVVVKF